MMKWLQEKLMGRYGVDELTRAILFGCVVLTILNLFVRLDVILIVVLALMVICYFRMFSKNTIKRYSENQKFLKFWNPIRSKLNHRISRLKDRRVNKYYKCPKCGKTIRVPRGKGKIAITCPMCKEEFIKKT